LGQPVAFLTRTVQGTLQAPDGPLPVLQDVQQCCGEVADKQTVNDRNPEIPQHTRLHPRQRIEIVIDEQQIPAVEYRFAGDEKQDQQRTYPGSEPKRGNSIDTGSVGHSVRLGCLVARHEFYCARH
jgi:hypothetical protein